MKSLALLFATAVPLAAASLIGLVQDPSGAAIAKAKVELTPGPLSTETDGAGKFTFPNVPAASYDLKVSREGFNDYTSKIEVRDKDKPALTVKLEVATVKETVEVTGKTGGANSDPVYRRGRDASLSETRLVENVVLKRDVGVLRFKSGTITFTPANMGRVTSAVFVGEGVFELKPFLSLESEYMKSLTGNESVNEPFKQAYFVFTDATYAEIEKQTRTTAADPKAAGVLKSFHSKLRYRNEQPRSMTEYLVMSESMDNLDADVLADLYNPKAAGFFTAYIKGDKHSDLRFFVRPRGVLPDRSPEEVGLIDVDPGADQEGIWYLSHYAAELEANKASSQEERHVVRPTFYNIETAIGGNNHLTATCDLEFEDIEDGSRVIKFGLLPNLRVTRVSHLGKDIRWIQESRKQDGSFYAIMPEPMTAGKSYLLTIEYQGDKVLTDYGGGNYAVEERTSWYPSLNYFRDRAKYRLTFKVPKQFTVVGVGKLLKEWKEGGYSASQWESTIPLAVAGFNYGVFKKKSAIDSATKYEVETFYNEETPAFLRDRGIGSLSTAGMAQTAIGQTQNALRIFTQWFGPAPYGRIAITQQPQANFGQSWPTLVYLPILAFLDSTQRYGLVGLQSRLTEFVDEVNAHEVSHQWWGHMLGWASHHDQWLSEGFAYFSAGLYLQFTEKKLDKHLQYWDHAREYLLQNNNFGKAPNDAGPMWMGFRLSTPKNRSGYNAVTYRKGGYVLQMLRSLMFDSKTGDQDFIAMMRDFVSSNTGKNPSTESFKKVVDKHIKPSMDLDGNKSMSWFFMDWVYGTQVPKYQFKYTVTPEADKFKVTFTLQQSQVNDQFRMLVPLYCEIDGRTVFIGRIPIVGNTTSKEQSVLLPKKPSKVLINAYHDVLERK